MKKLMLVLMASLFATQIMAQLNGSGRLVNPAFQFRDFDKIELLDLAGEIEVVSGQPFAIQVSIDDNLAPLLEVSAKNGKLKMELKGNRNNRLYIEKTNIRIKICLPEISVLEHSGNNLLRVKGITGRYFRLEKSGNGASELLGTIDELDIHQSGNGNLDAAGLSAKNIKIKKSGNGNAAVNALETLLVRSSGNGNTINKGPAPFDPASYSSGNGNLVSRYQKD